MYASPFEQLKELYEKARSIMEAKNHDYRGGSGDPYSNFRGSIIYGIDPVIGVLLRIQDKTKRIETFAKKGDLLVKGESIDDALIDIINYCALIRGIIMSDIPEDEDVQDVANYNTTEMVQVPTDHVEGLPIVDELPMMPPIAMLEGGC